VARQAGLQARAQALRRLLLDGIELMRPAKPVAFGDRAARSYQVLSLHYLEEMSVKQIAGELGIGDRQAYRELRGAEAELAGVLSATHGAPAWRVGASATSGSPGGASGQLPSRPSSGPQARQGSGGEPAAADDTLGLELGQVVSEAGRVGLRELLDVALSATTPLAARLGVHLADISQVADRDAEVQADEGLARQLLIQTLSLAIQSSAASGPDPGGVSLAITCRPPEVRLRIQYRCAEGAVASQQAPAPLSLAHRLAQAQGIGFEVGLDAAGASTLSLRFSAAQPRMVLVIEDNQGAVELYRRYLADDPDWQIVGVDDPRIAFETASRLQPTAVVLDIMMPRQDGWSVLQTLRTRPETELIPVLICSVFYDPGLAETLGASGYLKKPVSRRDFVAALEGCLQH
jgi:CheY-like chemotaxis protein